MKTLEQQHRLAFWIVIRPLKLLTITYSAPRSTQFFQFTETNTRDPEVIKISAVHTTLIGD